MPPEFPAVGQILSGHYLLERVLGEGGMGVVFLASDQDVKGEVFAIKVLKPEIRERPDALDLVREEVRKTRSIAHPNIIGMYSVNVDREVVYILMEYLEGKALNALIDDDFGRGMPFRRAWPLIEDICTGLAHAHDHSVIHSDLKPANIFITTAGKAKLLDFGIARAARGGAGRYDTSALGALTLAYASCEMLEGRGEPDQRDDVYSLGCVIYEMLSGRHPFDCPSALEARHDAVQIEPIHSISNRQNAVLAQTLAFDRAKRTPSVEALLAGLDPGNFQAASASRQSYAIWSGVVVFFLAAVLGLGWYLFVGGSNKAPRTSSQSGGSADTQLDQALSQAQSMVERARVLQIDPDDESLERGTQQLASAQASLAAGQKMDGLRRLGLSAESLSIAISRAKRLARLGSTPQEVAQAIAICEQTGTPCSAGDFADETPRTASLSPFEIDNVEVANRDFAEFVAAKQYVTGAEQDHGLFATKGSVGVFRPGESWNTLRSSMGTGVDSSDYPVRGIDYKSASDYCVWRRKRLPSESEWEFVARGRDHRLFAWGNEPRSLEPGSKKLLPVDEQPVTGLFGARGMGDGLLEWVDSGTSAKRVLRGASWLDTNPVAQRLAMRRLVDPTRAFALLDSGIRCSKSVETWSDQGSEGR
jgi:serine/threonine protein kinase/formylglycine-generating enzyme required for sulfatase activity